MQLRTLVTGANGRVGRVLRNGLGDLPVTFCGRDQLDVNDRPRLLEAMAGHAQVLHLASPLKGPMASAEVLRSWVDMVRAVLDSAGRAGVSRVLISSSIRAALGATPNKGWPAESEHGRACLEAEELGRAASGKGLEVVVIRLGTVRHPDAPSRELLLQPHWLSHEDCAAAFRSCLAAPVVPSRFSLFHAVSNLPSRVFDTENPFGWKPQTTAVGLRRIAISSAFQINVSIRSRLRLGTRLRAALQRVKR